MVEYGTSEQDPFDFICRGISGPMHIYEVLTYTRTAVNKCHWDRNIQWPSCFYSTRSQQRKQLIPEFECSNLNANERI